MVSSHELPVKRQLNFVTPTMSKKQKKTETAKAPSPTCDGCLWDVPGQQSHMGVGGCLHTVVVSDSD